MTPPSRTRSDHPLLIRRRDFLKQATGAVAVFGLGGLTGCGDDDFDGPFAEGFKVWIAQRVYGVVHRETTEDPIPNATVILGMGFDPENPFPFASVSTNLQGGFDFKAWEETEDQFWFLGHEDELPVQVYIKLTVEHPNFHPEAPVIQFTRTPSKDEPTRRLDLYTHNINVPMHRVLETDL